MIHQSIDLDDIATKIPHSYLKSIALGHHKIETSDDVIEAFDCGFKVGNMLHKHLPICRVFPGWGTVYYFSGDVSTVKDKLKNMYEQTAKEGKLITKPLFREVI